jgi:hypothetical protein
VGKFLGAESGGQSGEAKAAPVQWHEWGDFFISFGYVTRDGKQYPQTKAYDCHTGDSSEWEGIARYALRAWIFEQARRFLPAGVAATRVSSHAAAENGIVIECLKLTEVSATRPGPARLLASGRLRLKSASFAGRQERPGADYRVDFFLVRQPDSRYSDPLHAEHYVAAHTGHFSEETLSKETLSDEASGDETIQEFRVNFPAPGVGRYRLKSVVTLLASGKMSAQAAGPLLCVE